MPVSKKFAITFPDDLKAQLWEKAAELHRQPSSIVREAVKEWLTDPEAPAEAVKRGLDYSLEMDTLKHQVKSLTYFAEHLEEFGYFKQEPTEPNFDEPGGYVKAVIDLLDEPAGVDPTNAKILELLGMTAPVADDRPTTFEGSPIAPPVTSVITQRQGERCYHFDGNDGVTRWHETATPCPAGTTWAQRIGAADLKTTLDGKTL